MGLVDKFSSAFNKSFGVGINKYYSPDSPNFFGKSLGLPNITDRLLDSVLNNASKVSASGGMIGINDYGFKGKRQYIADRRYLLDLYVIALNNADIRTAITHLRNEIFRRGIEYEPAFAAHCDVCDRDYSINEARKTQGICPQDGAPLRKPDDSQIKPMEALLKKGNYFGQSLESILRECEDDLNVVDDAFLYCRKEYTLTEEEEMKLTMGQQPVIQESLKQLFRLDPVLVEFDLDYKGIPGMRHHVCVFHRDNLMEVETDSGWENEWGGICPECGIATKPIYFKYNEQYLQGGYGTAQSKVLYLTEDEVIHWSRYTPTETYGYPPLLTIYEQALTLIGMNRYLYDYFYERKVPQGVVTVVTDNVEGFNSTKSEVEARMQQDPHYIPWMAISSKSGQGKMEFVRFAYSLDELNYLPVRDEIRERISGLYGVSSIWMASMGGGGGLNNETQQLTVMSRVVEGAQRSYFSDVFPKLETALGITDWHFVINTPEETNELAEIQIIQAKATVASTFVQMGFGARWDAEAKEFTYDGEIKSMQEQMQTQQSMAAGPVATPGGGRLPQAPQEEEKNEPTRPPE